MHTAVSTLSGMATPAYASLHTCWWGLCKPFLHIRGWGLCKPFVPHTVLMGLSPSPLILVVSASKLRQTVQEEGTVCWYNWDGMIGIMGRFTGGEYETSKSLSTSCVRT